jgi:hypothetical protein
MPSSLLSPLAIARYTVFAMACGTFGNYVVAILAAFQRAELFQFCFPSAAVWF